MKPLADVGAINLYRIASVGCEFLAEPRRTPDPFLLVVSFQMPEWFMQFCNVIGRENDPSDQDTTFSVKL